jgi:membrane protease YdiL (CAAX protease family)
MQPGTESAGLWTVPGGRLRLGWRLLFFALLMFTLGAAATFVLPTGLIAGSGAILLASVGAGVLVLALDGRPAGALGFHVAPTGARESTLGLGLGVGVAVGVVALIAVGGGIQWTPEPGSVLGWVVGAIGALAFLALPAAAEEALLRGYPLQALAEEWGPAWALALTSAAFGALHLANPGVTPIATLNVAMAGVFLGVVYLKTLSLWWATGAHLGWNWGLGYLADAPVSGLDLLDAPLYDGAVTGPAWLGGGSFGPEGSLVASAAVAGAAALCWKAPWLRPSQAALAARPLATPLAYHGEGRA